ncbi:MAG: acyl-CoA dehydrogenase family protein [Xenococcaceae cyanobacterium MO_207.B15]|nr:acyl-CoA dehydrogenase family protein [Xenococcaceae cyanobacterium MO_207.B15]
MKPTQPEQLFKTAEAYLREIVAPQAAQIDRKPEIIEQVLKGMGDRYLLALRVPQNLGGAGFTEIDYSHFQILIARYSGALAFLQTQHQSAGSMLVASKNQELKQSYLPYMGTGEILVGVGFSQLRRHGNPIIKAQKVENGYLLEGEVPWITGFGFFDSFIIGATLPDGRELYGILPLHSQQQPTGGIINFSSPMELIAMNSTNTVSADIKQWFLADKEVVDIKPAGSIQEKSRKNVLHHGFYALGCAQAGLDILQSIHQKKQLPFLQQSWQTLQQELTNCHQAMFAATLDCTYPEKLKLRGWAINLAGRCSHAAVIASSGAANYQDHPAGRVYREALLFSVSGQTTAVMEESLNALL